MLFKLRRGNNKEKAVKAIRELDDNESYDVRITKKRWKRSISQNNLYWLWVTCIEHETGNDRNDLHEFFKARFLGFEEIKVLQYTVTRVISTTSKDTKRFKEYLDKIQLFASIELGIELPDPNDKYWSDFYETYKYML